MLRICYHIGVAEKTQKKRVPQVAGYDKGPRDFFRGSTGFFNKDLKIQNKGFIGMRRGSR